MKLYTFSHNMLSKEQQMIQAQHAQTELFNKYVFGAAPSKTDQHAILKDWSINYKTHVALNGGNSPELEELYRFIATSSNHGKFLYPFTSFWEDECINEMQTAIAMVLPMKIYHTAWMIRTKMILRTHNGFMINPNAVLEDVEIIDIKDSLDAWTFNSFDFELIERLNTYRLI